MRILLFLLCIGCSYDAFSQKIMISGKEGNRLLQWKDFTGTPDNNSPYYAFTAYSTQFKFKSVKFDGDKAILDGFEMTLEFRQDRSWVKNGKETDQLLKHEQGHFDIGLLYMQDVLNSMASASFPRTGYKEEFEKLMKAFHKKYADMGLQYDKETNHSINKEEQQKWNSFFEENVKR